MASPSFDFGIPQLRKKNIFEDPYSSQLTTPGLMDQSENPFGGMFKPDYTTPQVSGGNEDPNEDIKRIMEMTSKYYTPEHTASDRFNQFLASFPQEKRPSIGRTIVSALAGIGAKEGGGYDASQKVLDEPFKGDLEKWKAQAQPTYEAANLERQANVNERQLAGQMSTSAYNASKLRSADTKNRADLAERIRSDQAKEELNRSKQANDLSIAQSKQRLEQYKFDNPYLKFDFNSPTVQAFDQQTGEPFDTKVPSGHISDMDRAALNQKNRLAQIAAQGDQSRQTEGTRQGNRIVIEDKRAADARDLKGVENESQQRIGEARRAREAVNRDPTLSKYIKFNGPGSNDFTMEPPSEHWYNSVDADLIKRYQAAESRIYGLTPGNQAIGGSNQSPQSLGKNQPPASIARPPDDPNGVIQKSPNNPMIQIKTLPSGKVQYSNDGGNTWLDKKPLVGPSIGPNPQGGRYNAPTD